MAADGYPEVDLEKGRHPIGGEEDEREMGDLEREIYLQAELYADEENDSPEIKRKKRMARTALTMWKEKTETVEQRILQGQSEMRSIMNEVYNLVSLYSVFVGVVLTAVATSSRLGCRHLWSPVGLSLFAYFMLVVVAFKKFSEIRDLEETKVINRTVSGDTTKWVFKLREVGYADFDFDREEELDRRWEELSRRREALSRRREARYRRPQRRHPMRSVPFWRNALGLIVPLTIFTAGLVFSLIHILCWS